MHVIHRVLVLFLLVAPGAWIALWGARAVAAEPTAPAAPSGGIAVSGRIVDADGGPVVGAEVGLLRHPRRHTVRQAWATGARLPSHIVGTSGDDGRFVLRAPTAGLWLVTARAPGKAETLVFIQPLVRPTDVSDIVLPKARTVRVQVTDPDGQPVAGAAVFARPGRETNAEQGSGTATSNRASRPSARSRRAGHPRQLRSTLAQTDADGWARIEVAHDRISTLKVVAEGFLLAEKAHQRGKQATFILTAGMPRWVQVTHATGTPAVGALVVLDAQSPPLGETGPDGRVLITVPEDAKLAKKPLPILAYAADGSHGAVSIGKAAGADNGKPVRLVLDESTTLQGAVVDTLRREPIADAVVWANAREQVATRSDARGAFSLRVPGKASWLSAGAEDYLLGGVAVQGTHPATLALAPAGRLAGRVVDEQGEPVAGVAIEVSNRSSGNWRSAPRSMAARSDQDGAFVVVSLPVATSLLVVARRAGYAPGEREVMVPREGEAEPLEITLSAGIRAVGQVVDLEEQPLAGAEVRLVRMPASQAGFLGFSRMQGLEPLVSTTDREGRFEFEDLGAGRYGLGVTNRGHAPVDVPGVTVDASNRVADFGTVVMLDGAELTGVVVDADGGPIAEASIGIQARQGGIGYLDHRQSPLEAKSDSDGRFAVPDLRPDSPVDVVVRADGFVPAQLANVEVPSEEDLRVVLRAGIDLEGVVVDARGNGIQGAMVMVTSGPSPGQERRMGRVRERDGAFVVENLVPGDWSVVASADGFQNREMPPLTVTAGEAPPPLRIELDAGATLSGRVTAADGSPITSAYVTFRTTTRDPMREFGNQSTSTDGDGYYELRGLPLGRHVITFGHGRYQALERDLELESAAQTLDVTLEAGLEIAGYVVDPDGLPVAGAMVSTRAERTASARRFSGSLGSRIHESDTEGRFRIEGLGVGTYHVTAAKEGYASSVTGRAIELVDSSIEGVEVQLSLGGKIVGVVRGVGFDDLASVNVVALQSDVRRDMQSRVAGVDHEGRFELDNLAVGDWQVHASIGQRSKRKTITIPGAGVEVPVELDFGSGFTLSGVVLRAGVPAPGLGVSVRGIDTQGHGQQTTSPHGRFELPGLPAGRYELTVGHFGRFSRPLDRREIDLRGDEDIAVEIRTVTVTGRVVEAVGAQPVSGASITVRLETGNGVTALGSGRMQDAVSREDGTFRVGDVASGRYLVRVEKEGFAAASLPLEVTTAGPPADIEIALERSAGLRVRAVLPNGQPARDVAVAVLDATGRAIVLVNHVADAAGYAEIEQVPRGRWDLLISAGDAATTHVTAEVPGPPVEVALEPAGRLVVRVPAASESGRGFVSISDDRGVVRVVNRYGLLYDRWALSDGKVSIGQLPTGPVEVSATLPDGTTLRGTAQIVAHGYVEIELR